MGYGLDEYFSGLNPGTGFAVIEFAESDEFALVGFNLYPADGTGDVSDDLLGVDLVAGGDHAQALGVDDDFGHVEDFTHGEEF